MVKVSIVIPIYNMEKYLAQCLESILNQTLSEIELICVNDGSTDNSEQILELFSQKDGRINILSQKNQGVGIARNNGMNAATGKYLAFMDPDDYYLDDSVLMDMYTAAEIHSALICGGSLCEDHGNGQWFRKRFRGSFKNYTFKQNGFISYRDYQYDYGFYRFIYNREFLIKNNIYFPDYIRFQDPPFFVKAMISADRFWALSRITYCYRCGHQNFKWDEKRICALLSGLIDNLKLSAEAQMNTLHHLTVERIVFDFKEPLLLGIRNQNPKILTLMMDLKQNIDFSVIEKDIDCVKALNEFWRESEICRERGNDISFNNSEEYIYSKKSIFARIINRLKVEIRYAKRKIRGF